MIGILIYLYITLGVIVSLGNMFINSHLYSDKNLLFDYTRFVLLWPLVVMGFYK